MKDKNKQELEKQKLIKEKAKELPKKSLLVKKVPEIKSKSLERESYLRNKENDQKLNMNLSLKIITETKDNFKKKANKLINIKKVEITAPKIIKKSETEKKIFKTEIKKKEYKPKVEYKISPTKKENIETVKKTIIFNKIENNINSVNKEKENKNKSEEKEKQSQIKKIKIQPILKTNNLYTNKFKKIETNYVIKKNSEIDNLKFIEVIDTKKDKRINVKKTDKFKVNTIKTFKTNNNNDCKYFILKFLFYF